MLDTVDRETERSVRDRIDPAALERHVDAFDGLERISGTEDEWTASEYVVETLAEYGVAAALREFEAYVSVPEDARVAVTAPTARTFDDAITVSFGQTTPPNGAGGEVVYLEEITPETATAERVGGKVVFTEGLPTPEPIGLLDDGGAEAVVYESVSGEHLHEMIVTPVWGTPGLEAAAEIPEIPVAEVTEEAGAWLRERCREGPVEATVHADVTTEVTTLPCPVGRIDGSKSDRYAVVGNHVDSWYEGITDNATAMAVTLELARIFSDAEPARGLVFGFWPAHSTGRYAGSARFADEEWLDLRANGVAYVHLDLCGLRGADGLWHQEMAELADEHLDVLETASTLPVREGGESWLGGSRPARNSDQSFWGAGLSSLLSGARLDPSTDEGGPIGGGWWWHTPADTRDKVDLDVLAEETKLSATLLARICCSPVLPHDYRETVVDFRDQLADVAREVDREFGGVESELDALAEALENAYEVVESVDELGSPTGRATEDLQVTLGNELVPALYMTRRDYDQEPGLPHEPLPGLRDATGYENATARTRLFAATDRRRETNRLRHRVRSAREVVERFLEGERE